MKEALRDNGLSIVLFALFGLAITGLAWAGWLANNQERMHEGLRALTFNAYPASGPFISSVFENWESEFLRPGSRISPAA